MNVIKGITTWLVLQPQKKIPSGVKKNFLLKKVYEPYSLIKNPFPAKLQETADNIYPE